MQRAIWLFILLVTAAHTFAFSGEGHQIIATIAVEKLKGTRAEREIAALLGDKSLAEVSTWADRLKRKAFDDESAAFRSRNPGHDKWHYTNVPFQAGAYIEGGKGTSSTDVVHMIARCVKVLRGQEPEGQLTKKEALMLLVHLVGDLHQPLHVGCGYVSSDGLRFEDPASESRVGILNSDRGGNLSIYRGSVNVHSWLDGYTVQSAMRKAGYGRRWSDYARSLVTRAAAGEPRPPGDPAVWGRTWATDSLAQARVIYGQLALTGPDEYKGWGVTPAEGFETQAAGIIERQLRRGGGAVGGAPRGDLAMSCIAAGLESARQIAHVFLMQEAASPELKALRTPFLQAVVIGFVFSLLTHLPGAFGQPFRTAYLEHLAPCSILLLLASIDFVRGCHLVFIAITGDSEGGRGAVDRFTLWAFVYLAVYCGIQLGFVLVNGFVLALPLFGMIGFIAITGFTSYLTVSIRPSSRWSVCLHASFLFLMAAIMYFLAVSTSILGGAPFIDGKNPPDALEQTIRFLQRTR